MSLPRHSILAVAVASALAIPTVLTAPAAATAAPSALAVEAATAARTAAAYPTSSFDVTYGATYTRGTLLWAYRSVGVDGTQRAISTSGCRRTYVYTYDAGVNQLGVRSSSTLCDGVAPISFTVPADVPGGAAFVSVCLADGNGAALECVGYARP